MKKIFFSFFILSLLILSGCKTEEEQRLAPDGVDVLPKVTSISSCVSDVMEANPQMTTQQAEDNCITLEAVNDNNVRRCQDVSESFRQNCLDLFN